LAGQQDEVNPSYWREVVKMLGSYCQQDKLNPLIGVKVFGWTAGQGETLLLT